MAVIKICVVLIVVLQLTYLTDATMRPGSEHDPRVQRISKTISCQQCQQIVKVILTMEKNVTQWYQLTQTAEWMCQIAFANDTKLANLCGEVVNITMQFLIPDLAVPLGKFFGWDMPVAICADIIKVCSTPCCAQAAVPEQVHLSLNSSDSTEMRVAWVTLQPTPGAGVYWQCSGQPVESFAPEVSRTYKEGGWIGMIHSAVMTKLPAGTTCTYRVGSNSSVWSQFYFNTFPRNIGSKDRPMRFINLADMGYGEPSNFTVRRVVDHVRNGTIDFIIHHGDIAYSDANNPHEDSYWRKVEPFAAYVPYMLLPGNHEIWWNFTIYQMRTWMPPAGDGAPDDAMYYSLNIGPVSFVMMNSETWANTARIDATQVHWAARRFQDANAARKTRPWVFAVHHRPLYCNIEKDTSLDCSLSAGLLRAQVEALYVYAKVDVVLVAHMHHYERTWPIVDGNVVSHNYDSPPAPVHVLNGAAGNREGNESPPSSHFTAFGCGDVGYAIAEVVGDAEENYVNYKFFRSIDNKLLDDFSITK